MLPKLLTSRLKTILGMDYDAVLDAFSHERKGSFRINTLKSSEKEVLEEFEMKGIKVEIFTSMPWVYLFERSEEYAIKGSRAFYDGKIYLQSIASMLPVLVLAPERWESILDVCAAPGSKTTQMAMMMENTGKITALEQNQIRYDKLMYNVRLQWATMIEWVKADARKFFLPSWQGGMSEGQGGLVSEQKEQNPPSPLIRGAIFDRILLDAPCSAEGRIDIRNEKSYGFWSLENIKKKAELQYELLSLAVKQLKKWGTLVYSTCTLAPEENEGVISRVLAENPEISLEPIDIGLSGEKWWRSGLISFAGTNYGKDMERSVRILPSDITEGFFMAKIRKI